MYPTLRLCIPVHIYDTLICAIHRNLSQWLVNTYFFFVFYHGERVIYWSLTHRISGLDCFLPRKILGVCKEAWARKGCLFLEQRAVHILPSNETVFQAQQFSPIMQPTGCADIYHIHTGYKGYQYRHDSHCASFPLSNKVIWFSPMNLGLLLPPITRQ